LQGNDYQWILNSMFQDIGIRRITMKTYIKYSLAVTLMLTIGIIAAGTLTAGEQPIWHNYTNETTYSGNAPSEAQFSDTAQIWQTQVESFQKGNLPERAFVREASSDGLAVTKPVWCEQHKCS
jgi:hypothetical protein